MAPAKAPTNKPVLENFYSVKQAAIRLDLQDPDDPEDNRGEKWLRDGVNKLGWPCHRLAGQLKFSDSDLAQIAEINRNKKDGRSGPRRPRATRRAMPASLAA
ncbi:hypothetical protein ACGF5F_32390 [Streptomyces sp. NPDC047821]|uniref:hypothetical protein n=1 Tax=Streptomyces sp. NPDC047821 TaxID=3365488 RepID=UPI00371BEE69